MKFPAFEPINFKENTGLEIIELHLNRVFSDPNQPRKHFDPDRLEELVSSIKQHGVIQPIIVRELNENKYEIIAGERRWRASKMAGLLAIPAIIKKDNPKENSAISLIENIQREELNPIELAESFCRLVMEYDLSHESIASMVGKSRATVTNLLRLLNLSGHVRELLISGNLEMGHARALLTLPEEQQIDLAKKIVEKKLSVRESERLAKMTKLPKMEKMNPHESEVKVYLQRLEKSLSTKVSVQVNNKGEGKLVLHFETVGDLDGLVNRLVGEE